jgi:hypothetical protein
MTDAAEGLAAVLPIPDLAAPLPKEPEPLKADPLEPEPDNADPPRVEERPVPLDPPFNPCTADAELGLPALPTEPVRAALPAEPAPLGSVPEALPALVPARAALVPLKPVRAEPVVADPLPAFAPAAARALPEPMRPAAAA